jgi:hypothetical protein
MESLDDMSISWAFSWLEDPGRRGQPAAPRLILQIGKRQRRVILHSLM